MEIPGHIGDEDAAAYDREAARRHAREERWRRVRSLRLKNWFFSILWPFLILILFGVSEVGLYFLVQLVPGLTAHDAAVYAIAAQITLWIIFMATAVYVIYSPRSDAWIRRWGSRGRWEWDPMQKVRFHARFCAARHRGSATVFLGLSLLGVFDAWRNLNKPLPSEHQSFILVVGLLVWIVFLVYLSLSFTCIGERLALRIGAAASVPQLVFSVVPALS
jgi:hypothetical protein